MTQILPFPSIGRKKKEEKNKKDKATNNEEGGAGDPGGIEDPRAAPLLPRGKEERPGRRGGGHQRA